MQEHQGPFLLWGQSITATISKVFQSTRQSVRNGGISGPRPDRDWVLQDSTRRSNTLRLRRSHSHYIPAASFGFIEALVGNFE